MSQPFDPQQPPPPGHPAYGYPATSAATGPPPGSNIPALPPCTTRAWTEPVNLFEAASTRNY